MATMMIMMMMVVMTMIMKISFLWCFSLKHMLAPAEQIQTV